MWTVRRIDSTAGSSTLTWNTVPSGTPAGMRTGTGSRRSMVPPPRPIGVQLLGEPAIGPLDRGGGGVAGNTEDPVVILGLLHSQYTIGRGPKGCQVLTRPPLAHV